MIVKSPVISNHVKIVAVSRHQLLWQIGWTNSYYPRGHRLWKPSICNYARTLHDGRVMESYAYSAVFADVPESVWPFSFWVIIKAYADSEGNSFTEEQILRKELALQLIGVVKYGMAQHDKCIRLILQAAVNRLSEPENGLEQLFQNWKYNG